jgi:hypothetical protein
MARPSKQHEIGIWLKGLLSAGRRKADDVIAAAVAAGYATNPQNGTRTLRHVKAELGIISEKGEVWYWRDPAVEQAKPASADKIDVLTHKVDELTRLSQPAVPVPSATEWTPGEKSRVIDIHNPETQAKLDAIKRAHERFEEQQAIVTSADPFALLEDARDADKVQHMMVLVRNHQAKLETRSKGEPRYKQMWEVTERVEKQVTGREWNTKKGQWIDVPAVQTEETKYVSDVPVDGAKPISVQDGFEPGEDVTFEMGKWDTWIDQARERQKKLWADAKEQRQTEHADA